MHKLQLLLLECDESDVDDEKEDEYGSTHSEEKEQSTSGKKDTTTEVLEKLIKAYSM